MGIVAKILKDSISDRGDRLTTFYLKYPRFIHAEFLRHRMISHSVMSSRAISTEKMIKKVEEDPVIPIHWGLNQKGMSASNELDEISQIVAKGKWLEARDNAVKSARELLNCNLHKQILNRILEPWLHIEEVVSGTDWGNFFNLRVHKDAQPEFQALAKEILLKYIDSKPTLLKFGEWHLPSIDESHINFNINDQLKISFAICARSSYATFEGNPDITKDIKLHDDLTGVFHISPAEHQGRPMTHTEYIEHATKYGSYSGNFCGWMQYRKLIPNENRKEFNPTKLLEAL